MLKYIDVFTLWNAAEKTARRPITITEIGEATGIAHSTIRRMRVNEPCDPNKLVEVAKAIYTISGTKPPPLMPVVWWEDDPAEGADPKGSNGEPFGSKDDVVPA